MKIFNKLLVLLALLIFQTSVSAESIKITYIHNDAIGSPVAASDKDGTRVVDERYWPYGEKRYSDATLSEAKLGYTGHRSEDGLGLVYMGARYYDPVVGRFMGFDPVGFIEDSPESFNRYAYANNNPYRYVDPDGRLPFLIPVVVWIVKEAGGALIEHYTGIPASTKGLVKAGTKLVLNKQVKRSVTKRTPSIGGGGTLDKLSLGEIKRIQNAANRSGQDIGVVGSRVNPNKALRSNSDYDFVVNANSKTRNNLSRSLPGSKDVRTGAQNNQDIFRGSVDTTKPHAIFHPQ